MRLGGYSIPDGVTEIGRWAFDCCEELRHITMPTTVTTINEGAFGYCTSLEEIDLHEGIVYIGESAFEGCEQFESITIPSTVESLGAYSIYHLGSGNEFNVYCKPTTPPTTVSDRPADPENGYNPSSVGDIFSDELNIYVPVESYFAYCDLNDDCRMHDADPIYFVPYDFESGTVYEVGEFTLTSPSTISVPKEGGEYEIKFSKTHLFANKEVTLINDASWIKTVDSDGNSITIEVEATEQTSERSAEISVVCGGTAHAITVIQSSNEDSTEETYDYDVEMLDYTVTYYDDYADYGIHNYYAMFFIKGPVDGYLQTNDVMCQIDFYSDVAPQGGKFIPTGTYTFDATDSCNPGTFSSAYSKCYITNDTAAVKNGIMFSEGTVTVSESGVVGVVMTADDGTSIRFTYNGSTAGTGEAPEPEEPEGPEPELSTIHGDVAFEDVQIAQQVQNYGDYFGIGMNAFMVSGSCTDYMFQLQLLAPATQEGFDGTYQVLPSKSINPENYYFFPGEVDGDNAVASWFVDYTQEGMGPIVGGTITIETWASGITFYEFDVVDDAGNTIKGTMYAPAQSPGDAGPEEDIEIAVTDGIWITEEYGDYYEVGMMNFSLTLIEGDMEGEGFYLDLLRPMDATTLAGTYTAATGEVDPTKNYFVPSEYNLYMPTAGGVATGEYPIVDGTIVVEDKGNDVYLCTFDCVLDNDITVKGTFEAAKYVVPESSLKLAPRKITKKAVAITNKQLKAVKNVANSKNVTFKMR